MIKHDSAFKTNHSLLVCQNPKYMVCSHFSEGYSLEVRKTSSGTNNKLHFAMRLEVLNYQVACEERRERRGACEQEFSMLTQITSNVFYLNHAFIDLLRIPFTCT